MLAYIAMDQLCKTLFSMKEIMGLDIQTNTDGFDFPDRICPVNKTQNLGSRYLEFRIMRPHCIS